MFPHLPTPRHPLFLIIPSFGPFQCLLFGKSRWLLFLISITQCGWKPLAKVTTTNLIINIFSAGEGKQAQAVRTKPIWWENRTGFKRDSFQWVATWLLDLGLGTAQGGRGPSYQDGQPSLYTSPSVNRSLAPPFCKPHLPRLSAGSNKQINLNLEKSV